MHLGAGVLISSLVIFFATTGALLAYERPMLHAADRRFTLRIGLRKTPRLCHSTRCWQAQ
jgi:hypothetical protein